MPKQFYRTLAAVVVVLWLSACQAGPADPAGLKGAILLWHPQLEEGEEVFNQLAARFSAIYPEVTIVRTALPIDELHQEFLDQTELGFGPDLLIGDSRWVADFVEAGLIEDLSGREDIDTSIYFSSAVNTLRYTPRGADQARLYGLPFSLQTHVLFYNKKLVDGPPPATLSALLEQAHQGQKIAINTQFFGAFWGIQAFGGQLLDQEGRIVLDEGGFANWLGWLKNAQSDPNIILNDNSDALLDIFVKGEAAYYAGNSILLPPLQAILGEDVVGVARLPAGPQNNPAGPFLTTEALMLNTASSPAQKERALRLAQFLSNVEQQTTLTLKIGLVPANIQVRVDPRVSPTVAEILAQTKTAVPALNLSQVSDAVKYGDDVYLKALAGELDLNAAAIQLTGRVNAEHGFEAGQDTALIACGDQAAIEVWHSWPAAEAEVLNRIAADFEALCPATTITLRTISPAQEELHARYRQAVALGEGPDLLIADNRWVARLAGDGLLRDLAHLIKPQFLQRYVPRAQETMRFKGKLYGLPLSMESMALYYNPQLVTDPARNLDDLLNQASLERQAILPIGFYRAYWGIPAFGGQMFDSQNRLALNDGGFAAWLSWLQAAQEQPGLVLTDNLEQALELFIQQKAAYLVGEKWMLTPLQAQMGTESVAVAPLPDGPEGEARPFLVVEGLLLNPASGPARRAAAFEFARHLTGLQSQTLLMAQANRVPANVNVDPTAYPAIGGFLDQARTTFVPPNDRAEQVLFMMEQGQQVYAAVLKDGQEPAEAVNNFVTFIQKIEDEAVKISGD